MSVRRFGTQSLVRLLGNWQAPSSRTPLWRQLAEALRLLILDGRLALETRLPGERELATALNVSRTTIASALGLLREEGYLQSRQEVVHALRYLPALCSPESRRFRRHRSISPPPPSAPDRRFIKPTATR